MGVPIWEQLEKLDMKSANLMWPGPPITRDNISSTYFQKYERGWKLDDRLDRIASWLDLNDDDRPRFICGELQSFSACVQFLHDVILSICTRC
jgi:hypothetical protein